MHVKNLQLCLAHSKHSIDIGYLYTFCVLSFDGILNNDTYGFPIFTFFDLKQVYGSSSNEKTSAAILNLTTRWQHNQLTGNINVNR